MTSLCWWVSRIFYEKADKNRNEKIITNLQTCHNISIFENFQKSKNKKGEKSKVRKVLDSQRFFNDQVLVWWVVLVKVKPLHQVVGPSPEERDQCPPGEVLKRPRRRLQCEQTLSEL